MKKSLFIYIITAMFINILLPLVLALLFIGTASGEIQLTYVVILIWALLNIFAYSLYFIIPGLIKKMGKNTNIYFAKYSNEFTYN